MPTDRQRQGGCGMDNAGQLEVELFSGGLESSAAVAFMIQLRGIE
jgi:hypothetical protein